MTNSVWSACWIKEYLIQQMTNSVIKDWIKLVEAEAIRYEKVKRDSERTKQYNKTIQELGKAAYHALKQHGEFHVWSNA